jgi:hypothetical protein
VFEYVLGMWSPCVGNIFATFSEGFGDALGMY